MNKCLAFLGVRHVQLHLMSTLLLLDSFVFQCLYSIFATTAMHSDETGEFQQVISSFTLSEKYLVSAGSSAMVIVCNCVVALLVTVVNNKYLLLTSTVVEIICHFVLRTVTIRFGSHGLLVIGATVIFLQTSHYPIAINILAKWIPPNEYTRAAAVLISCNNLGFNLCSYFMPKHKVFAAKTIAIMIGFKVTWCAVYLLLGAQDPQTSYLVRRAEWTMLSEKIGPRKTIKMKLQIPWRSIFSSAPLYGFMFTDVAVRLFYLARFTIEDTSNIKFALLFIPIFVICVAWLVDILIWNSVVSVNNARKTLITVSLWGTAFCVAFMCFNGNMFHRKIAYTIMANYLISLSDLSFVGSMWNMSPNYAAVIYCIATTPSWSVIAINFAIANRRETFDKDVLSEFYTVGLLLFLFNYAFLMCGDIYPRKFDSFGATDWRKESVVSYP